MADHKEIDAITGTATTGHEWDGIKELNTPLPRWWVWLFYITIVWGIGYWVAYPTWPMVSDFTRGVLGYSSRADVTAEVAALQAKRSGTATKLASASLEQIEKDPALLNFARAQGKAVFGDNCAPCHGSGATGSKGYPNLNDDDWLWGGKLADIQQTITHGIRNEVTESRQGNMPAFGGSAGVLKKEEIVQVANYARTLSGLAARQGVDVAAGKKVFADNCAACHGEDGKGNLDLGAPNLTDAIWLYSNDEAQIIANVTNGIGGSMPAWGKRLDATTIKALTVYVHTLGGGK